MSYMDSPLLTLRELMPGSTGSSKDDTDLDQSFRADRIEFMVVQRDLTASEARESGVIEDPGDVDWDIPTAEQYEDIVGHLFDIFTDDDSQLIHAFRWSSVGSTTGVGCFSVKTGKHGHLEDIRGVLRSIILKGQCFESFPKKALMKTFSLTAYFPRSTKCVGTKKLLHWLLSCNRGLKGNIWPIEARKYPDDHPIVRRRGARIVSFTGDQDFLDSLQRFPKEFPFNIKLANVYVRGGARTTEGKAPVRRRRPKMTAKALRNLLTRHGKEIVEDAEAEDDEKTQKKSTSTN